MDIAFVPLRRQGPSQAPKGALGQRRRKIFPLGIHSLNLAELRLPLPFFQLRLTKTRVLNVFMSLEPDEKLAVVFAGEAGHEPFSMLPRALGQFTGYANVERSIAPTGHDVDITGLHLGENGWTAVKAPAQV
jgi:hypothetical protein